jgi:hypothetical protein
MMGNRVAIAALAALCLPACTTEPAPAEESVILDDEFAVAARTYDVPVDLLKAIAYVETGWHAAVPEEEGGELDEMGRPVAFGVFGLRGDNLVRGATASGADLEQVRTSTTANISAAAARLADLASDAGVRGDDLTAWTPVVARFAQVEGDDARAAYIDDVMRVLAVGAKTVAEDGRVIAQLEPHFDMELPHPGVAYSAGGDFADGIWRPSPNYSSRSSMLSRAWKRLSRTRKNSLHAPIYLA